MNHKTFSQCDSSFRLDLFKIQKSSELNGMYAVHLYNACNVLGGMSVNQFAPSLMAHLITNITAYKLI